MHDHTLSHTTVAAWPHSRTHNCRCTHSRTHTQLSHHDHTHTQTQLSLHGHTHTDRSKPALPPGNLSVTWKTSSQSPAAELFLDGGSSDARATVAKNVEEMCVLTEGRALSPRQASALHPPPPPSVSLSHQRLSFSHTHTHSHGPRTHARPQTHTHTQLLAAALRLASLCRERPRWRVPLCQC